MQSPPKLFAGYYFRLFGDFAGGIPKSKLRQLLLICGGEEVAEQGLGDQRRTLITVVHDTTKLSLRQKKAFSEIPKSVVVHTDWVLNCLSRYQILNAEIMCGMLELEH